jgi:hypothetical protein
MIVVGRGLVGRCVCLLGMGGAGEGFGGYAFGTIWKILYSQLHNIETSQKVEGLLVTTFHDY